MQKHPDKTDLRDQLITYLLGQSDMSAKDLEELINNIFSPVLKQEIMISGTGFLAVAAREAAQTVRAEEQKKAEKAAKKAKIALAAAQKEIEKTKQEALLSKRLMVMRSWHRDIAIEWITDIAGMPHDEVSALILAFEKVKAQMDDDIHKLVNLSGLAEQEVKTLLLLLKK